MLATALTYLTLKEIIAREAFSVSSCYSSLAVTVQAWQNMIILHGYLQGFKDEPIIYSRAHLDMKASTTKLLKLVHVFETRCPADSHIFGTCRYTTISEKVVRRDSDVPGKSENLKNHENHKKVSTHSFAMASSIYCLCEPLSDNFFLFLLSLL